VANVLVRFFDQFATRPARAIRSVQDWLHFWISGTGILSYICTDFQSAGAALAETRCLRVHPPLIEKISVSRHVFAQIRQARS
jgi:hypothetical protein